MASSILSKQIYTKTSCAQLQYRKKRRNGLQSHRLSKIWQISIQIQNFFQKPNHRICFSILISSHDRITNSLVRFLEDLMAGKFAFKIYWPLATFPSGVPVSVWSASVSKTITSSKVFLTLASAMVAAFKCSELWSFCFLTANWPLLRV